MLCFSHWQHATALLRYVRFFGWNYRLYYWTATGLADQYLFQF